MTPEQKAYLAGMLDADGSMVLYIRNQEDLKIPYRVRPGIIFYQDTQYRFVLERFREWVGVGYVYDRNDGISEFRIEGYTQCSKLALNLMDYLIVKQKQASLIVKAAEVVEQGRKSLEAFLETCALSDQISALNFKSKRKHTLASVKARLLELGIITSP